MRSESMDALDRVRSYGIIPVLGLKNPKTAPALAEALEKGGLPLIEVTLRNPGALECIEAIKAEHPSILVGAGTVLTCAQADSAKKSGADFIVSPGFNPRVVQHCLERKIPIVPGCTTASEIEIALELGLTTVKFFPSESLGGLGMINQLAGPFSNVKFVVTGGMDFNTIERYLKNDHVAAVGGSFVAPNRLIESNSWDEITALCKKAVSMSLGFAIAHVGFSGSSSAEGTATAEWFSERFGLPVTKGERSTFAGTDIESGNIPFPGEHGHIGFYTNSVERAVAYFSRKEIPLREEFKHVDGKGNLNAVYLAEEIRGFAVHIVKR